MFDASCKALPLALSVALAACTHAGAVPTPAPDAGPRAALQSFLDAEQAGDFTRAYSLLAGPLRARYTPARLQQDFERDRALAEEKLARIRAALATGVAMKLADSRAELPLGADRATRLLEEDGAWRIESLE